MIAARYQPAWAESSKVPAALQSARIEADRIPDNDGLIASGVPREPVLQCLTKAGLLAGRCRPWVSSNLPA